MFIHGMESFLWFSVLIAAPAVLLAALDRAFFGTGKRCRRLRAAMAAAGGAVLLLMGGDWLLGRLGLAWRNLPAGVLSAAAILGGAACALLTAACVSGGGETGGLGRKLSAGTVTVCALSLCAVLLFYGPLAAALAFGGREQAVEYEGRALLERDEGFLDPAYEYYDYHGPLVRGAEGLFWRETPLSEAEK